MTMMANTPIQISNNDLQRSIPGNFPEKFYHVNGWIEFGFRFQGRQGALFCV
jgi:hypothetical protein